MPVTPPLPRLTQKKEPNAKLFYMNKKVEENYYTINMNSYPTAWPDPKSKWPQLPNCLNLEGLLMTDEKFEHLRNWWWLQFEDVMALAPEVLPPMRVVNHRINLVNMSIRHPEQCATCPQALEDQLREKMTCYEHAEWWVHHPVPTACP